MTQLLKHYPIKIPFKYESRDGIHIFLPKGSPHIQWMEERGFHKSYYGYCPLMLKADATYQDKYKGKIAYLIGKGPSCDKLTKDYFKIKDAPVIATNEAYLLAKRLDLPNPIFFTQADAPPRYYVGHEDIIIVPHKVAHNYLGYPKVYVIETDKGPGYLTTNFAIQIARYFGCTKLIMLCFDAMRGITGYPQCLLDDLSVKRLADHVMQSERIKLFLEKLKVDYEVILPK